VLFGVSGFVLNVELIAAAGTTDCFGFSGLLIRHECSVRHDSQVRQMMG
jgi:hypothetical protein